MTTYDEIQKQRAQEEARRFNLDDLQIGDGATFCIHSDNQAGTVIARTPTTSCIVRRAVLPVTYQDANAIVTNATPTVALQSFRAALSSCATAVPKSFTR